MVQIYPNLNNIRSVWDFVTKSEITENQNPQDRAKINKQINQMIDFNNRIRGNKWFLAGWFTLIIQFLQFTLVVRFLLRKPSDGNKYKM